MKAVLPGKPAEPGKPAGQPREESFTLAVGQRQDDIEVLEIDEKAGTVKVNNFGAEMTLSFKDDGVKTTSAPPPGPIPQPAPFFPPGFPAPGQTAANPANGGFNT